MEEANSCIEEDEEPCATSSGVSKLFDSACAHVRTMVAKGDKSVDNDSLLYLYGRYKQATEGPCSESSATKPTIFDFQGRKKWTAWNALGKTSSQQAMKEYVEKVVELNCDWNPEQKDGSKARQNFGVCVSRPLAEDEEYVNGDFEQDSPLIAAVKTGDISEVKRLTATPSTLEFRDSDGMTALHWACDRGYLQIVLHLLAAGANINAEDSESQTPLHFSVSCEHAEIVTVLLEHGADQNAVDSEGRKPSDLADSVVIRILFQL